MLLDLERPSLRGVTRLAEELAGRIDVPVIRGSIDWKDVLWSNFGFTTTKDDKHHWGQERLLDAIFVHHKKVIVVRAGKRGGKSKACTAAVQAFMKTNRGVHTWVCSNTYNLCQYVFAPLWNKATGTDEPLGEVSSKSRKDWKVEFADGGLIQARSWDDGDNLEGESLDILIGDEAQTLDQYRFEKMYARIMDRDGVMILIGSPMASDAWYLGMCEEAKLNPDYEYIEWTTEDNPFIDPLFLANARRDLSTDAYDEMFMNKTRMPEGLVFSEEFDNRDSVFKGNPDPNIEMELWIDPGTTNSAYGGAIVQIIDDEVRVYEEFYEHHTFSEKVIEVARKMKYYHRVKRIVMDIAGRQHHDKEKSPKEIWQSVTHLPVFDTKVNILTGIERHKTFLKQPNSGRRRLKIHERCLKTIMEYNNWRYPKRRPEAGERRLPVDAFNHILKAITYGLVHRFSYYDTQVGKRKSHYI